MDPSVTRNDDAERYEIAVDGVVAGVAQFRAKPGLIAFIHTEIDERFEGRGLGGILVAGALDDARERRMAVLPFCPFVNAYIQRHHEYADLVPAKYHDEFGL
jgi:predicted GNAT family acetyltransferase